MNYPVRCRICHELIGWYSEPMMVTCRGCNKADAEKANDPEPVVVRDFLVETLRSAPVEITFNEAGYRQMSLGKACHDAAARIEALELELKAAQANQCDSQGSVDLCGTTISGGTSCIYCRKCRRWRNKVCA